MKLYPLQEEELKDFTIDFFYEFSNFVGLPHFISYATDQPPSYNELLLAHKHMMIGGRYQFTNYQFPTGINNTERITITKVNSKIFVYVNGVLVNQTTSSAAGSIKKGGVWILSQEQDCMEGCFEESQRFIGKICNFQMWNYGMNQSSTDKLFLNDGLMDPGNIFDNPPSYTFEEKHGAFISKSKYQGMY